MKLFLHLFQCFSMMSLYSILILTNNLAESSTLKSNSIKDIYQTDKENTMTQQNRKTNLTERPQTNNSTKTGYSIKSLDIKLSLRSDETSGSVIENVEFDLTMGKYSSLVRKISLGGSSDSPVGFIITSKDILIKKTYIVSNCMDRKAQDEENLSFHYVCVILLFDELEVISNNKVINVEYSYTSQNILRKNPYENSNYLIYVIDNLKSRSEIRKAFITVTLETIENSKENLNKTIIKTIPEGISTVDVKENKANISLKRSIEVRSNDYFSYEVDFPLINEESLLMGDEYYHSERGFFKLQLISWGFIGALFVYMLMYIYTNEKDSFAALNISEEVKLFNRPHRHGESAEEILLDNGD